jgi:hypothetical protein
MHSNRPGATLFELLVVLILLGVFASIAAPSLRTTMDMLAVRGAREAAFGLFARARVLALQHGGADIVLNAGSDRIQVRTADGKVRAELSLAQRSVDLLLAGADPIVLRYDAYGLGRMMSRTVTLRGQEAYAGLTISSFGRVRRW